MSKIEAGLKKYVDYFNNFSEETVDDLKDVVAEDVYFRDPFNETYTADQMLHVMRDVFEVTKETTFDMREYVLKDNLAYLKWRCDFTPKKAKKSFEIIGVSEVKLNSRGLVTSHVDYWDAAEYFYSKIPILGGIIRLIKNKLKVKF